MLQTKHPVPIFTSSVDRFTAKAESENERLKKKKSIIQSIVRLAAGACLRSPAFRVFPCLRQSACAPEIPALLRPTYVLQRQWQRREENTPGVQTPRCQGLDKFQLQTDTCPAFKSDAFYSFLSPFFLSIDQFLWNQDKKTYFLYFLFDLQRRTTDKLSQLSCGLHTQEMQILFQVFVPGCKTL